MGKLLWSAMQPAPRQKTSYRWWVYGLFTAVMRPSDNANNHCGYTFNHINRVYVFLEDTIGKRKNTG